MKDKIEQIRQLSLTVDSVEVKDTLDQLANALQSEYESLETKLKLTTKLSIGRKLKMSELYLKVDNLSKLELKLNVLQQLNENLSKYKLAALSEKKLYNDRIKTFFDTKLSNLNSKDYAKLKQLHSQFNFLLDDLKVYDENKKNYLLLDLAGVFGNDRLISKPLPKPLSNKKTTSSGSRWNKS